MKEDILSEYRWIAIDQVSGKALKITVHDDGVELTPCLVACLSAEAAGQCIDNVFGKHPSFRSRFKIVRAKKAELPRVPFHIDETMVPQAILGGQA